MKKIAVIGAGLSGLVVARRLSELADVVVFEKSRGVGGRMATRYAGDYEFDHGAQFFTARTPEFRAFLQPLIADGVVATWPAEFVEFDHDRQAASRTWGDDSPHFVGAPRMNSIGKYLSAGVSVTLKTAVAGVRRKDDGWELVDESQTVLGRFDWVVITAPPSQTAVLAKDCPELVSLCQQRKMLGCFALMLGFSQPLDLAWQAAVVRNADISWLAVNSSKPGRTGPFTLVVHSSNAWAESHIDDDIDSLLEKVLGEASTVTGEDLRQADHRQLHRWRYSNIGAHALPERFIDDRMQLAACGDWFVRGRVEAAFTSASALAGELLQRL
ncbi:MAG: FAD-dependent oxidoreductase [Gammaproteobacteria bacterium]|nr:FAD-dependent oxidoreductase [Gammaproteobacteria bacterium]